jgi:nitrite reductase/ring-hydroxylating ferredoxin subunit
MGLWAWLDDNMPKDVPLQVIPKVRWADQAPTYQQAEPAIIDAALRRAERRPSGNWYVFAASTDVRGDRPFGATVAGVEIVAWRDGQRGLHVGPASCPHLGADLATGKIDCGGLVCPWHGLRLEGGREFGWKPYPAHDDGVLVWVRLDKAGGEEPLAAPVLPVRPIGARLAAVARLEGVCEPRDVIANRLDPWHGAWFHPYSFAQLGVLSAPPADADDDADVFQVAVTFHMGRLGVPVIAEFSVPEPRTIVMHIVDGEGAGSVVETHATPLGPGVDGRPRTAVIEAVIAQSDRAGFRHALTAAPVIRPLMQLAARRLWKDDLVYAERRYALRAKGNG